MPPGQFFISLDFELLWGLRHHTSVAEFEKTGKNARRAIRHILDLFETYEVNATWGVVGLLLCENKQQMCAQVAKIKSAVGEHPYLDALQQYILNNVGADEFADPLHYGKSLVNEIGETGRHEIGTHTFTHAPFTLEGFSTDFFVSDLQQAIEHAKEKGYHMRSLIFPWNTYNESNLIACRKLGIEHFRAVEKSPFHHRADQLPYRMGRWAENYLPLCDKISRNSLPSENTTPEPLPATRFFCPRLFQRPIFRNLQMRRIRTEMKKAAREGSIYHLWWHPHNFAENLTGALHQLEQLLSEYALLQNQYGFTSRVFSDVRK